MYHSHTLYFEVSAQTLSCLNSKTLLLLKAATEKIVLVLSRPEQQDGVSNGEVVSARWEIWDKPGETKLSNSPV